MPTQLVYANDTCIITISVMKLCIQGGPKNGTVYFERLNFVKYEQIFKILSLPESGENL